MNIQSGTASLPAVGSAPARETASAGTTGAQESVSPPPPPQVEAPSQPPLSSEAVQQAARQINHFLQSSNSNLQFSVDSESHDVIVRVVDSETKEVIRQIPSEEMVAISHKLDQLSGLLLQQKA